MSQVWRSETDRAMKHVGLSEPGVEEFQSWSAGAQSRLSQDCVMVDLPLILTENSCALPLTGNGPDVKVSAASVWCPLCLPGGASLQGLM
ncbi:hypothetical protein O3P69_009695 [Scylla paramamosain]|uniref:Uncharacterized protein n=1 Tax=Scylla paramamosain TaxID=85552 RepID=A0AAW0SDH3_SCYPA